MKNTQTIKTKAGYALTPHEESCLRSLKRLAAKWHRHTNRLWLFSANSHLTALQTRAGKPNPFRVGMKASAY